MIDEAAGQQAALAEAVVAVFATQRVGFGAEVEGFQFLALHHLERVVIHVGVGADVFDVVGLGKLAVELLGGVEAAVEALLGEPLVSFDVIDAAFGIIDHERGETAFEETRTGMAAVIADHDAAGQRGIASILKLLQPRAHAGVADAAALGVASVLVVSALLVSALRGCHAADDGQLIHLTGEQRDVIGDADAIDVGVDDLREAHDVRFVRLRVKGVEMAHAAIHV